ncbi:hypothetical protein [Petroclostridium sp. X23]|uniref:hypothetical protein n=1 Tax=Petroclostridium sp. X23 TaxID=3045146 RepID=UPI0024AC849B|nr:hypothetical protein [Petroclostridium sp. X23]WHH61550.1 hypothetical protein QKW49_12980 [Petroclostridium sp. X23]
MWSRMIPLGAALLTEITFFYNMFLFFSYDKTDKIMWIGYIPWVAGSMIILLFNDRILRKARTIGFLVAVNTVLITLWILAGFYSFFQMDGVGTYCWAVFLMIITGVRSAYLALQTVSEQQALIRTEISFLAAGCFFATQAGPFDVPMAFNMPTFIMIVVNMLVLIRFRIGTGELKNSQAIRWQGAFFILTLLGLIVGLVTSTLLFISPSFREWILKGISVFIDLIVWVFKEIHRLLSMLFDHSVQEPMVLPPPSDPMNGQEMIKEEIPAANIWILLSLAGASVVAAGLWLFMRLRKNMLFKRQLVIPRQQSSGNWKWDVLRRFAAFIAKMWRKLKFILSWLRCRYTPEGMFLTIETLGKYKGFPRIISETPGVYLRRLSDISQPQNGCEQQDIKKLIHILSIELEKSLYGKKEGNEQSGMLDQKELKKIQKHFLFWYPEKPKNRI